MNGILNCKNRGLTPIFLRVQLPQERHKLHSHAGAWER